MKKFGTVIVRLVPVKHMGNLTHDLDNDKRPGYVNKSKSHLNTVIVGTNLQDAKALYNIQKNNMINDFNHEKNRLRELLEQQNLTAKELTKERRKIRNWQTHMCSHMSGLIGFGLDADARLLNPSTMDACAKAYLADLCKRHQVEVLYLVKHMDESNPHYHFVTTNYDTSKKRTLRLNRDDLRQEQDEIGNAFEKLGLGRGIDKQARIKQASEKLGIPAINGKYDKKVFEEANVIHKSVKQLHETLPLEIAKKHSEVANLESLISEQEAKLNRNNALISKNEALLAALEQDNGNESIKLDKVRKRLDSYHKRAADALSEIERLSINVEPVKEKIVKFVKSDKEGPSGRKIVISKVTVADPIAVNKSYKQIKAKEIKLKKAQSDHKRQIDLDHKKLLEQQRASELYIQKQIYKHLLVFGEEPTDLEDMLDFLKWHDEKTGWTKTTAGTSFKIQEVDGKVKRIVVDNTGNPSPDKVAFTLLYAARKKGMKSGRFTGRDEVLIELWKQNIANGEPVQINLSSEQVLILEANGISIPDNKSIPNN